MSTIHTAGQRGYGWAAARQRVWTEGTFAKSKTQCVSLGKSFWRKAQAATGGAQHHAESTHGKEEGKDTGGAGPETGAVPFPQQKAKGRARAPNVGGTTKYCRAMLSSHELPSWGESLFYPFKGIHSLEKTTPF